MGKYEILRERLDEMPEIQWILSEPATDGQLALVHTPEYVRSVVSGVLSPSAQREIGFEWTPGMVIRARGSSGATIQAARTALSEGVSGNLAGGTHHAYPDKGSGFCVFNDVAVAARLMQAEWSRSRPRQTLKVAIIDLDVHQGNGTARIFQGDESVFTLSLHGVRNFPFRKEAGDLDIELADGTGEDAYLAALEQALLTLEQRFEPQLVFYLVGADPHEGDRLGRLKLSFDGLEARDRRVFDWAWQRRLPLAFAMAGGYGRDITQTVQVQVHTFGIALSYWRRWQAKR
ncbi:MAG: histone deacetylase [Alphaproteobacteria bacterium]|nr:histone deacetylase [Alphaproteobacteria bacterium]